MTKTLLLGAAAALVFVGGASAATKPTAMVKGAQANHVVFAGKGGAKTLYDSTGGFAGNGVDSQNFESTFAQYDDQGADDFTVPKKTTWTITEVDAAGVYYNGYGPSTDENVIFYSDSKGKPGKAVKKGTFNNVKGKDSSGSYTISLKKGIALKSGTYWVSVVSNCSFSGGCGQWGWGTTATKTGTGGQWQNPGGGFGVCPTWGPITTCISGNTDPDFAFALKGKAKKGK